MRHFLKRCWLYFSLVFIVCLFFWKVFLRGCVPLPLDFVVGAYFPWLDYKWGYSTGVPVKNPIVSDATSFIFPMQIYSINLIRSGQLPLWNNLILGGVPLLANFQSAPFSLNNFLYFITDSLSAWSLQVILQHVFAAVFVCLLLRSWRVTKLGSFLGGIIFAFSGFNLFWSEWNGHTLAAAYIPLILLFVDRFLKRGKYFDGVGISISLALLIFSGYPQIALYLSFAVALLWLVRIYQQKDWLRKTFFLTVFLILGFGLSAPQILPGWELLTQSQRTLEPHPFSWAFLPWQKIITFLAPDFFGNHATANYWGPQDYSSNIGFIGIVAFVLSLVSLGLLKQKKEVFFGLLLLITSLLLALPTPLSIFLWKSGFLGLNAASAHRSLVLFNLGGAILAGFGWDWLATTRPKKIGRIVSIFLPAIILLGFGIYAYAIREKLIFSQSVFRVASRNLVLPTAVLIISGLVVFFRPKLKPVLIFLAVVELFYFGWKFTPLSPRRIAFPTTPIIDFLTSQEKPYRVVADKVISTNLLMNYGVETLEGYDAVYPAQISKFIATINGNYESLNSIRRYAIIDNYFSRLLDLGNVKYLVIFKKDLAQYLASGKFKVAFEDKSVVVLENLGVLPRSFQVDKWEVERDEKRILERLLDPNFPIGEKIILEEDPGEVAAFYFISDTFFPGWKAYVNGKEAKIYRADFAFRAVPIPAKGAEVRFVYEPKSFLDGIKIGLLSLSLLLLLLAIWKRKL